MGPTATEDALDAGLLHFAADVSSKLLIVGGKNDLVVSIPCKIAQDFNEGLGMNQIMRL